MIAVCIAPCWVEWGPGDHCWAAQASFVRQASENAAAENSYRREEFPLLDTLQFLFNNATNEYIQYKLDDRNEVLMRYIQSLQDTGHNRMSLKNLKGNHSYGVGLSFQGDVDLRNQLFNIVLIRFYNDEMCTVVLFDFDILFIVCCPPLPLTPPQSDACKKIWLSTKRSLSLLPELIGS